VQIGSPGGERERVIMEYGRLVADLAAMATAMLNVVFPLREMVGGPCVMMAAGISLAEGAVSSEKDHGWSGPAAGSAVERASQTATRTTAWRRLTTDIDEHEHPSGLGE
jgi:hypothetical protein